MRCSIFVLNQRTVKACLIALRVSWVCKIKDSITIKHKNKQHSKHSIYSNVTYCFWLQYKYFSIITNILVLSEYQVKTILVWKTRYHLPESNKFYNLINRLKDRLLDKFYLQFFFKSFLEDFTGFGCFIFFTSHVNPLRFASKLTNAFSIN